MWYNISVILFVWLLYDLIKGEVWSFHKIYRCDEPVKYWIVMCIWTILAIGSLILSNLSFNW